MNEITPRELSTLIGLSRQRDRLAKTTVKARAAKLKADLEKQMETYYRFEDDKVWKEAMKEAKETVEAARAVIMRRNEELGIPKRFAPSLHMQWYHGNSYSAEAQKNQLRKTIGIRVDAMLKAANAEIERASLEAQTKLAVHGLTSKQAKDLLASLPQPEQLLPMVTFQEVRKLIGLKDDDDDHHSDDDET